MKRSSLSRGRSPMKRKNAKRQKRLFEENFGGEDFLAHIKSFSCAICGANKNFSVAAHLTSRGAGGKAKDCISLCCTRYGIEGCHERYDAHDPEIRKHEPRLRELAAKRYAEFFGGRVPVEDET